LDPLGRGNGSTHPRQNHAQGKCTNHQSKQELPLNKCQLLAQTGQAGSQDWSDRFHQNRLDQFPKPVRPISYSRPHPPKDKKEKEMHKLPLDSWDRF
jgi:hypothetical protein